MRAKQTKVCDAERAGFHTPIFILVPNPARPVRYHARVQLPSDRQANKFDRGFPSVDDGFRLVDQDGNDADLI